MFFQFSMNKNIKHETQIFIFLFMFLIPVSLCTSPFFLYPCDQLFSLSLTTRSYTSPHPMHMAPSYPYPYPSLNPPLSKASFIPINPFQFSHTYCHLISLYTTPHAHHHLFPLYTTCLSKPIFFTH